MGAAPKRPRPDRAGHADLAYLAMDRGPTPEQFAAVLVLDGDPGVVAVERALARRAPTIRRLRQRLVRTPPGCGRPVWVDDPGFDVRRHLTVLRSGPPGDTAALVETALPAVTARLPRDRPLWRAVYVTGLAQGRAALVLVVHHVLADGIGGLAVLAGLADGGSMSAPPAVASPSARQLAVDAALGRLRAIRQLPTLWRQFRTAMRAGGGFVPPPPTPCSLLAPTSRARRVAVTAVPLAPLRRAAHANGGSVNAALLTAVAGGLQELLRRRGETVDRFTVAVPVAARRSTSTTELGNQVSPLLLTVPGSGALRQRITEVADTVRQRRDLATGPAPITLLGPVFRALAAAGGFRWYMRRQHRTHTLVSFVRGPTAPIQIADTTVRAIIPLSVGETGNMTVTFVALSYADTVTATAVADPHHVPELNDLIAAVHAELARITAVPT